jgi:putative radical SAM enzyme (TIGR03279 family)
MIRIAGIARDSIAEAIELEAGSTLISLNGVELRDSLDLLYLQAEERLELEAETAAGERRVYDIEKGPDDSLGIVPEPDKIRRCTNACAFCFVKGNPRANKLRASLYIKDDDYRLSFLYGHYVTLTNLREEDWTRIVEQRLSPLYVSVHATDPSVRLAMLRNPRSAEINEDLDRLQAGGVAFHAQVVLCKNLNDGSVLERTMEDLYERGPDVLSLSIVPVGLTAHNAERGIEGLTTADCRSVLGQVDAIRARSLDERGTGWCYAADELFLRAGEEVPGREYFDTDDLIGNGVGAVSGLRDTVRAALGDFPKLRGRRIVLVTGTSMGPSLGELGREISRASGAEVRTAVQENTLFGPSVTSAGLLSGVDVERALRPHEECDLALISRTALNDEDRFLDDVTMAELRDALPGLEICPSENIVDVLSRL